MTLTETGTKLGKSSSTEHVLLDYPITNEETILKRYTFSYDLGSGAYATVKYAHCVKTKQPFAIKIISKTKIPKNYLKKFVPREVDALKRLSIHQHAFISQLREFFETPQRVYLVTKLALGGDLLNYINSRKYLNEDTARRMIAQLLCALDHIHDLDVVHRDLKCENLLIGPEECIMVSDFGFATQQPKNRLLTTFCGSYAYAAPEILAGSSYNGKFTDVWSVGVILYAMLNGKLPYNDTKPKNILAKIKTAPLVMTRQVSLACEKFVRNILTINAMERPMVSDLLTKKWVEHTMKKILKTLPEKNHPSCFKLRLPHKNSFRMSDSSEECLKVFTPRQSRLSPQTPITIADEFIIHHSSHKTSSTVSERMKLKYRQIKSNVKTWASRKRKGVGVVDSQVEFAEIKDRPAELQTREILVDIFNSPKKEVNQTNDAPIKLKYAIHGRETPASLKKVVNISKVAGDVRSASAVPPINNGRHYSADFRAKSCKQNHKLSNITTQNTAISAKGRRISQESAKGRRISQESAKGRRISQDNSKGRKISQDSGRSNDKKNTVAERRASESSKKDLAINDQIIQYLAEGREVNKPTIQPISPIGLPPLKKKSQDTIVRGKRRSSIPKAEEKRRASYDKALLYHNIQTVSNKIDAGSALGNRMAITLTPTKVVAVNPASRGRRSSHGSRKGSMEKKAMVGIRELSTVYN